MSATVQPHGALAPRRDDPSGFPREKADTRVARMLGCSTDHAKRLRLSIIPEGITAIMTATRDDPAKSEAFRRVCAVALSLEAQPDLTPDLILAAATGDAAEDVARTLALVDGEITPSERRVWCQRLREEIGAKAHLLRALEGTR